MASHHPIHMHPVRPFYRFSATMLGASMWFFVSHGMLGARGKFVDVFAADVPSEKGWPRAAGVEASMGTLI